jgi:SAM-dependent methyltransferase
VASEHLARNRALWDLVNEQFSGADGRALWNRTDIVWGLHATPESALGVLGDVRGIDVVELGCGVAHISAWLARRGARVLAVDLSGGQLRSAQQAQAEHRLRFPLVQADAEMLPLADGCADLVVSEHGTPAWCAPDAWVGQAARILRPGGRLVFLTNSPLSAMCVPAEGGPAGDRLLRGPAELGTITWPGGGTEHHPSHSEWIRILVRHGFQVESLHELHAPAASGDDEQGAGTDASRFYDIADLAWARRWPAEDLWSARLRS